MRKIITSLFLSGLVLSVAPISSVDAKEIPPKTYSTCAALRKDYPNGVAVDWYSRGTSKAAVKKLDKKATGLMCAPKTK
jgi:hypothetical protein